VSRGIAPLIPTIGNIGDELSASHPGYFSPAEITTPTQWTESRVRLRTHLNIVEKEKNLFPLLGTVPWIIQNIAYS